MIIAIDGPAGSGKSTVSKLVAKRLGFFYLDTGAMYRAVTLAAMRSAINLEDEKGIAKLAKRQDIDFMVNGSGHSMIVLNDEDVSSDIRLPEVTNKVKYIARIPSVRKYMVSLQRKIASAKNVVIEGRDTTTVVFPKADHKIYLDASTEIRAKRRYDELIQKGFDVSYEEILRDQEKRDKSDFLRKVGALKKAKDAKVIDTSDMTINEVVLEVMKISNTAKDKWNPLWSVLRPIGLFLGVVFFNLKRYGLPNLPERGGFILASNHKSHLDPVFLGASSPRQLSYIARSSLFKGGGFFSWLIKSLNAYPLRRSATDRSALNKAVEILVNGGALVIFPEGTRSETGEIQEGKTGIGYIALRLGVPVIPVFLDGTEKALPKGSKKIKRCNVRVSFGERVDLDDLAAGKLTKNSYLEATGRIMASLKNLREELAGV